MTKTEQFHEAMLELYRTAKREANYDAKPFLSMVVMDGGLATAKRLLGETVIQYGFSKLWEKGKLKLTVEFLVLQDEWRELFSAQELETARHRLAEHGMVINNW